MEIINGNQLFVAYKKSLINIFDCNLVDELYLPIIGKNAASIYRYLEMHTDEQTPHVWAFDFLEMTPKQFLESRKYLEAVGLLSTYYSKVRESYIYLLYAPKSPKDFFDDILLNGLLIHNIGKERASYLLHKFIAPKQIQEGFSCIDASFNEVFKDDIESSSFEFDVADKSYIIGRNSKNIVLEFDSQSFLNKLAMKINCDINTISNEEILGIKSLYSLYGFNEDFMADIVAEVYNDFAPVGSKIDINKLKNKCYSLQSFNSLSKNKNEKNVKIASKKKLAKKINLMSELTPINYLKLKQNNITPVKADVNLIYNLSKKLSLNNAVINALLDYVLETNNNILSSSLTEKIGASLVRENITTAFDACEYLYKPKIKVNKKVVNDDDEKQIEEKNEELKLNVEDENDLKDLLQKADKQ